MKHATDSTRIKLSELPDLEKLLAKIYSYSVKSIKKNNIEVKDVTLKKVNEFYLVLNSLKNSLSVISTLRSNRKNMESVYLK